MCLNQNENPNSSPAVSAIVFSTIASPSSGLINIKVPAVVPVV